MAREVPLLARLDHDDLAWDHVPKSADAERDHPVATWEPAAGGRILHREGNQLDQSAEIDISGNSLGLSLVVSESSDLGKERFES